MGEVTKLISVKHILIGWADYDGEEINELKDRQLEERHRRQLAENYEQRITDMDEFLKENTVKLVEYDDELVRRIVSRINVLSVDRIQIEYINRLKTGLLFRNV